MAESAASSSRVLLLLLFNTTRTTPDPQAREPLSLWTEAWPLLLLFNTTRMVPGPPSTGVAIAMDGGTAAAVKHTTPRAPRAHALRAPKHERGP